MRKIEQQMIDALETKAGAWHKDNTSLFYVSAQESGNPYGARAEIYLHGNHIADYWYDSRQLDVDLVTLQRWPTMTTRSRLRALGADLVCIKGTLHLNGKSIYAE